MYVYCNHVAGLNCPHISVTVEAYDLWFGGSVTLDGNEQGLGVCAVTIYNNFNEETFDLGVANYSSCVVVHNSSIPGIYFVDVSCLVPSLASTGSTKGLTSASPSSANSVPLMTGPPMEYTLLRCPEKQASCLNGSSLFDINFKNLTTPFTSYASQTLSVSY